MGRKIQYHLSIARHVTFKMEIFPNVNRACLLLRTRQKSSPAKPRGTGNVSMLMTKPGVRGMKIPVDSKKVQKQPGIILKDYILKKVTATFLGK